MTESKIEQELEAIKTIAEVLAPLDKNAQQRALQYAMQHLGLTAGSDDALDRNRSRDRSVESDSSRAGEQIDPNAGQDGQITDIRSFTKTKNPSSDVEMAVIVAYYLSELVPDEMRKVSIGTKDVTTYFKQAGYPLPSEPRFALKNAKVAGYLESAGHGQYKLNPVGYNLVAHTLPRATDAPMPKKRKARKKKAANKKTANKKSSKV